MKKNIKIIVGIVVIGIGIYVAFNWKVISRQIGLLGEKFITKSTATVLSGGESLGAAEYGTWN